jgi:hypothetical protein
MVGKDLSAGGGGGAGDGFCAFAVINKPIARVKTNANRPFDNMWLIVIFAPRFAADNVVIKP